MIQYSSARTKHITHQWFSNFYTSPVRRKQSYM